MSIKLPFDLSKPLAGEASIDLDKPLDQVFEFVGQRFFENYPKWALEVAEFEPLDGTEVFVGAKAKQSRNENNNTVMSVFEVVDFDPVYHLSVQGINAPYKQHYHLSPCEQQPESTRLTFRFELTEIEVFMRPFEKLIRYAIEEGAENTVNNIKQLLCSDTAPATA